MADGDRTLTTASFDKVGWATTDWMAIHLPLRLDSAIAQI